MVVGFLLIPGGLIVSDQGARSQRLSICVSQNRYQAMFNYLIFYMAGKWQALSQFLAIVRQDRIYLGR
jgi:hypothetical protein